MRHAVAINAAAAAFLTLTLATTPSARAAPQDEPAPCNPGPLPISLSSEPLIDLDVLVVLDGIAQDVAAPLLEPARKSYEPLGIRLVMSFMETSLPFGHPLYTARDMLGGRRPEGFDAVYVLSNQTRGNAMCVGGVASDEQAFAEGPMLPSLRLGPLGLTLNGTAKTFAHEIGHLLGGQHHFGNCTEGAGVDSDGGQSEPTACTIMLPTTPPLLPPGIPDWLASSQALQSFRFSTVNAAIVRGHAELWATP